MSLDHTFYTKCIPSRSLLAASIYITPEVYMKYWIIPAGIAATAGIYRNITYDDSQLGFFNQKVWWNSNRIIHSILSLIFIILVIRGDYKTAKIIPILDLFIGIFSVYSHYSNNT